MESPNDTMIGVLEVHVATALAAQAPYSSRLSARSAPCTDLQVLLDDRPQALSSDPYRKRHVPVGFVLVALLSIATPAVAFRPLPLSARDQKALHDNFALCFS